MLNITEKAKVFLAELIELRGFPEETAIRLFCGDRGLSMIGDNERAGDMVFRYEGRTVLVLDEHFSGLFADCCLFVDGSELKLRRNNDQA